jgi:3-hydroxyisobutyrate dehydrogenase-like beta-hydroxyacid dehydrogenase
MNIAIIGCGEVGYFYAEAISAAGYSLQLCTPRPSEKILKLVSEKNTILHKQISDWLSNIDILISCTPGSVALAVAKEAIPFLKTGALFSDFSSSSPDDKREAASLAAAKEIFFM